MDVQGCDKSSVTLYMPPGLAASYEVNNTFLCKLLSFKKIVLGAYSSNLLYVGRRDPDSSK